MRPSVVHAQLTVSSERTFFRRSLRRLVKPAFGGEHQTSRFITAKLHNNRPGLVLTGRTDVSLTEAVASVNKFAANVYVQLSLAKRNDTLGSVGGTRVGVCLRYAVEQQAVASAVLFQGVHLVGERLVIAVEGSQFTLDRPTCVRNRLSAFQVVQGFSALAGRCSSALILRCTLASRGSRPRVFP